MHQQAGQRSGDETFERPGAGELDVEDAFSAHQIEYWIWHVNRLVPASSGKAARLRELDALREARSRKHSVRDTQRGLRGSMIVGRLLTWIRAVALHS